MWKKVRITAAGTGMRTVAKEEGQHVTRYNMYTITFDCQRSHNPTRR
jgi:hypothetical protein